MKLGVINAASKTALTVLQSYLAKSGSKFEQIYLLDSYPDYRSYSTVFNFLKDKKDLNNFHIEKTYQKYYMKKTTDQCDALLFFTHNYYINSTCKNQNLKNFSELLDPSSQQTVDVINLAEKAQTIEGDIFFIDAINTEKEFGNLHTKAKFYWTDFIYGGPTEFLDFVKLKGSLPSTGKTYHFVHADKVADAILKIRQEQTLSQFYHIANNIEKTDGELATLNGSYGLHLGENLISQTFTCSDMRQNYRLWANPPNLNQHLRSYSNLSSNAKYGDLDLKNDPNVNAVVNTG